MRKLAVVLALAAACSDEGLDRLEERTGAVREEALDGAREARREAVSAEQAAREKSLVARIEDPEAYAELVTSGRVDPLLDATAESSPPAVRRLACIALGEVGGPRARDRLLELLQTQTDDKEADGWMRLYAAAGLTILGDPATAVDLLLMLSTVNQNDSFALLAAADRSDEYFTIDAQICDAVLGMGLWNAEESLVEQMEREHRIRVGIDAYAVLRRRTGLDLPYHYNGSYADRAAQAAAWREALRATRAERKRAHPFRAADDPAFLADVAMLIDWLRGSAIRLRLAAQKVLFYVGEPAVVPLVAALESDDPVAQRQAAHVLGLIADPCSSLALRRALAVQDPDARAEAVGALRAIGDRSAREDVRKLLRDPDAEVRARAAGYLAEVGDADDVPALQAALESERAPATATALAAACYRLGDRAARARLLDVLVKGELLDREAALAALEAVDGPLAGYDPKGTAEERARAVGANR